MSRPVSASTSANATSAPDEARGIGGGEERHRRHDQPVVCSEAERHRRKVQRRGAAAAGDRVGGADALGEGALECLDRRPGRQIVGAQAAVTAAMSSSSMSCRP